MQLHTCQVPLEKDEKLTPVVEKFTNLIKINDNMIRQCMIYLLFDTPIYL